MLNYNFFCKGSFYKFRMTTENEKGNSLKADEKEEDVKKEPINMRRRVSSILIPEKVHSLDWRNRVKSRLKYAFIVYIFALLLILKYFGNFYYIATRLTYYLHGPVIPFCGWKYISNFDAWNVALPDSNSFYHISEFYLDEGDEVRIRGESLPYARYFSFQTYSLTDLVALDSIRDFDVIVDPPETQIKQGFPIGYNAYNNISAAQNQDRLGSYTIYLTALKDQNYPNELKALPGNSTRGIFNLFLRVYVEDEDYVHLPADIKAKNISKAWGYVPPPIVEIRRRRDCKNKNINNSQGQQENIGSSNALTEMHQDDKQSHDTCQWQTLPFCYLRRKSGFRINRFFSDVSKPILRCQKFEGFDNKKNHWVYGTKKLKVGKYANKDAEYMGSCANTLNIDIDSTLPPFLQSTTTRNLWLYLCKFLHQHHVNLIINLLTFVEEQTANILTWVYHCNFDLWVAMNKATISTIFGIIKFVYYHIISLYNNSVKLYIENYFTGCNEFDNDTAALKTCKEYSYRKVKISGEMAKDGQSTFIDGKQEQDDYFFDDYSEDDEDNSEMPFPFNINYFSSEQKVDSDLCKGKRQIKPFRRLYARIDAKLPKTPSSLYNRPFIANFTDYDVRYVSFNINARTIPLRGYMSVKDSEIVRHYTNHVFNRREVTSNAAKAWKDWNENRIFTIWVLPFDAESPFLPKEVEESEGLILRWGRSLFKTDIAYPAILYRQILPSSEVLHERFDSPEALSHLTDNLCNWDPKCCNIESNFIKASLLKDKNNFSNVLNNNISTCSSDKIDEGTAQQNIPFDKVEYCFHPKNLRYIMQDYYPNITYYVSSKYPTDFTIDNKPITPEGVEEEDNVCVQENTYPFEKVYLLPYLNEIDPIA